MQALVAAGVDVDAANVDGHTSLHEVSEPRAADAAVALLAAGANPDAADVARWMALHHAVQSSRIEMIAAILRHGARHAPWSCDGAAPLAMAVQIGCSVRAVFGHST